MTPNMAITSSKQTVPLTYHSTIESDATSTAANHVTGTNSTLYAVTIDNDLNAGTIVFLKIYDSTSATVGTDAPYLTLPADADEKNITYHIPQGLTFTTGISLACVTDGGGDAGTTSPTSDVIVRLLHT